jgi:predicted hydrocarbon binding protein
MASTEKVYLPRDYFAFDFKSGGKFAEFVVELDNKPGAIQRVAGTLSNHHVNILSGIHHFPPLAPSGSWSFFIDLNSSDIPLEALVKELEKTALKVRSTGSDEFLVDTMHFPLLVANERAIVIGAAVLSSLLGQIRLLFGESPTTDVILHQMGLASGRTWFEHIKHKIELDVLTRDVGKVLTIFSALGWGIFKLDHIDFKQNSAQISMKEGFECKYATKRTTPQSHFIRGVVEGILESLFQNKMNVTETTCISTGDPACTFIAKRRETIQS